MSHAMLDHGQCLDGTVHLTPQELRVLAALAAGMTSQTAARRLDISDRTVRRRVQGVCDRVGVDTTIEAVTWAAKNDLI